MSPDIISGRDRFRPISTLLWGVLISFVVAYGVYRLLNHRAMTLAQAQATEVQLAKDDLLSLASHQLRTPATGVKQYIGMLREGYAGTLTTDQRAFLDMAYESNERQLHIINELLYVAKADSGRIVLAKRRLSINRLVREVADEHKSAFAESQHKLKLRLPHRDVMIVADSHCLRMALDNLVSNAIKYTPEGGLVEIAVRVDETHVHIAVKDSGVGIDRSQMPNLFKRFSRIPNELSEQSGGSGIGLYLARHLVNLHKGDITVESEVGKGTCFTIQLPLEGTPD